MTVHSRFGGSSIYILKFCPGSLRLSKDMDDFGTSAAAEEGTAEHEMSEFALRMGISTYDCVGLTFNNHVIDETMAADGMVYVGEVRRIVAENPGAVLLVEPKVVMSSVSTEVFGYIDAMVYVPNKRKLYTGDLKYGYGLVESSTVQLQHYNVSALDTFGLWDKVDEFESFIVQPRGEHIDGDIRRTYYTIADAHQQREMFRQIYLSAISDDAPVVAGEHCRYCRASPVCRARLMRTFNLLYQDAPLHTLAKGEVMEAYKELATMKRQLERIEAKANEYGAAGQKLDGYKMVKRKAFHICEDEAGLVNAIMTHPASGIKDRTQLYNMRLKGKTALRDIPGVPRSVVNQYFKAPDNVGIELAPLSDTRPAVGIGAAIGRFEPVSGAQIAQRFPSVI